MFKASLSLWKGNSGRMVATELQRKDQEQSFSSPDAQAIKGLAGSVWGGVCSCVQQGDMVKHHLLMSSTFSLAWVCLKAIMGHLWIKAISLIKENTWVKKWWEDSVSVP